MTRVKVIGAGSIGNHLSNASRRLGWQVDLVDNDRAALERTRAEIYPARYGAWDAEIALHHSSEAPRGGHDYIFVGTPPDGRGQRHVALGLLFQDREGFAIATGRRRQPLRVGHPRLGP